MKEITKPKNNVMSRTLVAIAVLVLVGFLGFALARAGSTTSNSTDTSSKNTVTNNPQRLSECMAPYQDEITAAKGNLMYQQIGQDTSPFYKALNDGAAGIQACHDKYGY